jgi:hypothetical protein
MVQTLPGKLPADFIGRECPTNEGVGKAPTYLVLEHCETITRARSGSTERSQQYACFGGPAAPMIVTVTVFMIVVVVVIMLVVMIVVVVVITALLVFHRLMP